MTVLFGTASKLMLIYKVKPDPRNREKHECSAACHSQTPGAITFQRWAITFQRSVKQLNIMILMTHTPTE